MIRKKVEIEYDHFEPGDVVRRKTVATTEWAKERIIVSQMVNLPEVDRSANFKDEHGVTYMASMFELVLEEPSTDAEIVKVLASPLFIDLTQMNPYYWKVRYWDPNPIDGEIKEKMAETAIEALQFLAKKMRKTNKQ